MAHETEAKIPVSSFAPIRDALRRENATYLGTVLQSDTYFDTPDGQLQHSDRGMRIRRLELLETGSGEWDLRPQLTYKGPREGNSAYKMRREIQTHFDAPHAMVEVLEACGMVQSMVIQKRRSSYRLARCLVELDALPFIGRFVEIEGPDEEAIDALTHRLELQGRTIHDSYLHLADTHLRGENRDPTVVTFAAAGRAG
jgi:predicted adenylyl cyclase CyaB